MRIRLVAATLLVGLQASAAYAADLEGDVHDKTSGKPVREATITVVGTGKQGAAGQDGAFRMQALPAGAYAIRIEAPGYVPFVVKDVPLRDDRPVVLRAKLRPGIAAVAGQRITADRPSRLAQTETSRRSLTGEEVTKIAGARNDPVLAIANTAGVKSAGFSGAPAVRGGGPNDNRYLIDGIEIGNPYHFGGLVSVFNAGTISKVDLYSGALPARFGNALSAVIDIETRQPKTDRLHGQVDTNLLYSEALLEGPLGPQAGISFAGRRSYIDVVALPLLSAAVPNLIPAGTVLPYFTDYQGKFTLALPAGGRIDLVGIGALDSTRLVLPDGGVGRGIGELSLDSGYRSTGAVWKHPVSDTVSNRLTLNYQEPFTDIQAGRFFALQDFRFRWTIADDVAWQATDEHQIRAGLRYDTINYVARRIQPDFSKLPRRPGMRGGPGGGFGVGVTSGGNVVTSPAGGSAGSSTSQATGSAPLTPSATSSAPAGLPTAEEIEALPKKTTDTFGNQKVYGAYVEDAWKPTENLTLSLGLRYDELQSTAENRVGPRGGLSWRLDPDTTVRLAYGQQWQFPGEDQLLPGTGNPGLRAAFSKDYVAGLDRQLSDRLFGRLELYYRNLFGLVTSDRTENYLNMGAGRSYGAEATFELAETWGWTSSLALTLARSFRTRPDGVEIPYEYDQPIVANLLATGPKYWEWTPSLRFRYSSGRPYTPVIDRKQDETGTWQPVNGDRNSRNYPDGITWSARLERPLRSWGLDDALYLEVTQQAEVLGVSYGPKGEYENISNPTFNYGLPPLPYLGYRIKF